MTYKVHIDYVSEVYRIEGVKKTNAVVIRNLV